MSGHSSHGGHRGHWPKICETLHCCRDGISLSSGFLPACSTPIHSNRTRRKGQKPVTGRPHLPLPKEKHHCSVSLYPPHTRASPVCGWASFLLISFSSTSLKLNLVSIQRNGLHMILFSYIYSIVPYFVFAPPQSAPLFFTLAGPLPPSLPLKSFFFCFYSIYTYTHTHTYITILLHLISFLTHFLSLS